MSSRARDLEPSRRLTAAVAALFALSGAVAIAQEVAWSAALSRQLGHGSAAVSVVAAIFLLGLALGAAAGGRLATRWQRPLLTYAVLEAGIGLSSLLVLEVLGRLPRWVALLGPGLVTESGRGLLLRAVLTAATLLPPTLLMGATLPVLAALLARDPRSAARAAGFLAAVNAGGGAAGALIAVFFILPRTGSHVMLLATAGLSLLVAVFALLLAAGAPRSRRLLPRPEVTGAGTSVPLLLPLMLIAAGVGSLVVQVAWTRVLAWLLGPSVYAFSILLAVTILGLAMGGALGAAPAARSCHPLLLFARLELALGIAVMLTVILGPALPSAVAALAAATMGAPRWLQAGELALAAGLLLLPTGLMGAAFPVACRLMAARRGVAGGVAAASAWLTAGNVVGALLAGFVMPAVIDSRLTLLAAATLYLAVAAAAGALTATTPVSRLRRSLPAIAAGLLLAVVPAWDTATFASAPALNGPRYAAAARATGKNIAAAMRSRGNILFAEEGADALVTVHSLPGGGASLQINGRTEASTSGDLRAQLLAAHLPLMHAREPGTVLVIGLASGISAGAALQHAPRQLTVVEVAPTVVRAARCGAFDAAAGRPLDDPRLRLVIADARTLLQADPETYDVIASQPSHPWVAGVAGLYTQEFFTLVRSRLAPEGIFGQWLQAYGLTSSDFRLVLRTFAAVFPHVRLYEESVGGGDYFLVGSAQPLQTSAAGFASRLSPAVQGDLERVGIDSLGAILGLRVLDDRGVRLHAGPGPVLTDSRLRLAYSAPLSLSRETGSRLVAELETLRPPSASGVDLDGLGKDQALHLRAELARRDQDREEEITFLESVDDRTLMALGVPHVNEAVALARAGLPRAAYSLLLEILVQETGPPALQILAGDLALRLGEIELAQIHFDAALERQPDSPAAHTGLGLVRMNAAHPIAAAASFAAALRAAPGSRRALLGLGGAYLAAGEAESAQSVLLETVKRHPGSARAWSNLGVAHRRLGDNEAAERAYRRALELEPHLSQAWYNLGILLQNRGDVVQAQQAFQSGYQSAPDDCDLLQVLDPPPAEWPASCPGPSP